jgi:hypothetical protein
MIDWSAVLSTLGSTAILVGAITFLVKAAINHLLSRDLDTHKAALKREADLELANVRSRSDCEIAEVKTRSDRELAELKARADTELAFAKERWETALLEQKAEFDREMAMFQTSLASEAARADRIREQIVRWANPIFGSVMDLTGRLRNILQDRGYLALSEETDRDIGANWSIRYEYFLSSTIFLFCQYLCWIRLLQESLSFELFEKHEAKDKFFGKVYAVGRNLSAYPLEELGGLPSSEDLQVFNLQQRAIGELLIVQDGAERRCMRYSEFLQKWPDPVFKRLLDPLIRFVDGLTPANSRRWKRLELMFQSLEDLHEQCRVLLARD